VPTRELADQIEKEAKTLGKYLKLKCISIYGGVSYEGQRKMLAQTPRLIVATPGRLIDFIKQGDLDMKQAEVMVLDEADRLLDMGFIKDIKYIYAQLVEKEQRLNMLFSATLSNEVGNISLNYMNNPLDIVIASDTITVDKIEQGVFHVGAKEKMSLLLALLKSENPYNAIIFTNTKWGAERVAEKINKIGLQAEVISGNIAQNKRSKIVAKIKEGKLQYLVATDVASRGLHIPHLSLVINYDLPDESENYVHRIGRTARAGATG
jgi:ATP-dependent RNA helicase RhlB